MDTPETTPAAPTRACASCSAPLERHQDWCLECGTAVPGRLAAARPGWRAVATTLALTLVLVGGAGAASYAALSSDANREAIASVPGDGTPLAQAPPAVPAPAAPVLPAPAPEAPVTVKTPPAKLPVAPKATAQVPTPPLVITPAPTATPEPNSPQNTTPTPKADPAPRGQGTSAAGGGTGESAASLEPIALGAESVAVYDPYKRAVDPGDTADAYDGDEGTAFALSSKNDDRELQVGLVVDLEARKKVGGVELKLGTTGGRVEVYATDSAALPPDILDTRWDHPASRPNLGTSERILFPKGGANYRYVIFWFTVPPTSGRTIRVKELKLLG